MAEATAAQRLLLEEGDLPFGAPAFDRIVADAVLPALDAAIVAATAEIAAIANDAAAPTFENTVVALERAGAGLARVRRIFWTLAGAQATDAIRAIEGEVSARLTRYATAVSHDTRLFARIDAVWRARDSLVLDEAQGRLLADSHRGFVHGGALLGANAKARFAAIDEELAALSTRFGQNVLACGADWSLLLSADQCDGLPEATIAAMHARAASREQDGHLLTLDRGDVEAFLTFGRDRSLRETVWRAFVTRCDGGAHDNRAAIDAILALRHERAALLGYASYADYAIADSMAKTPDAAEALLMRVWSPAVAQAAAEATTLQQIADGDGVTLAAWDWRFYAERVRRDRYALDGAAVKAHLTLAGVRDAAFAVAGRLYGLNFTPRPDLPGWHPDVCAWLVADADGAPRGLLYTDYYARQEKHGGAWMGAIRVQEALDGRVLPIVYTVANFARAPDGAETGLSIDEARTLFHEFGHALHALLSDVVFPSQSGTAVARDFVEFPSKVMEHWIVAPQVLAELGVPPELVAAIGHADAFGQGFATVEFVASAILDMALHRATDVAPDSAAIAAAALARIGMPALIAPRHGLTHFAHVFDGGYAASYYSYLWSEVLDEDAFAAFVASGDLFDPALAARLREEVLARGDTRDPMASFVAFRGREPDEAPLLRARGLTAEAALTGF